MKESRLKTFGTPLTMWLGVNVVRYQSHSGQYYAASAKRSCSLVHAHSEKKKKLQSHEFHRTCSWSLSHGLVNLKIRTWEGQHSLNSPSRVFIVSWVYVIYDIITSSSKAYICQEKILVHFRPLTVGCPWLADVAFLVPLFATRGQHT